MEFRGKMAGAGWIRAHRKIQEHPSWSHDGMFKLLFYCWQEANYRPSTYLIPGTTDTITIERGAFITGRETLCDALYPQKTAAKPVARTVYRWLQSLEQMDCVTLRIVSNRCTIVTVKNYDLYNPPEGAACPTDVPPVSSSCPARVPPVSTSEEGKEGEQGKKKRKNTPKPPKGDDDLSMIPIPESLDTPEFATAWSEWITHRKQIRKPMTDMQARKQLAQMVGFGVKKSIAMINHTIANGWQGLVDPDERRNGGKPVPEKPYLPTSAEINRRGYNANTGELGPEP